MSETKQEPPIILKEGEDFEVIESIPHKRKPETFRGRWERVMDRVKLYSSEAGKSAKKYFGHFWDEWESATKKSLFNPVLWVARKGRWLADDGMEKLGEFGLDTFVSGFERVKKWKVDSLQWSDEKINQALEWVDELLQSGKKKIEEEVGLHKELFMVIAVQSKRAAESIAEDIKNGATWVKRAGEEHAKKMLNDLSYFSNIAALGAQSAPGEVIEGVREGMEGLGEFTRKHFRKIVVAALVGVAGAGGYYGVKQFRGSDEKPKSSAKPFAPDSTASFTTIDTTMAGFELAELDSIPPIADSVGVGPLEHIGKPTTIDGKLGLIVSAIDFDYEKTDPVVRGVLMEDVRAIVWSAGRWTKAELKNMPDSTVYGLYKDRSVFREALADNGELFDSAFQLAPDAPATGGYYFLNTGSLRTMYDNASDGEKSVK